MPIAANRQSRLEVLDQPDAFGVGGGPDRIERRHDHGRQVHRFDLERQLARDDPRDVEDVFNETRLGLGVALNDLHRVIGFLFERPASQNAGPAENRVERCAQFVRQRGKKLVFEPIGLLRLAVQPDLRDRDPEAAHQIVQHRQVTRAKAIRRGRRQREDADHLVIDDERHQHGARTSECIEVLRMRAFTEQRAGEVWIHLR